MRWDDLVVAISAAAAADPVLASIYGETIRAAGTAKHQVPALDYQLVSDSKEPDIWAPHVIQWDQWTDTLEQLMASERALMALFDREFDLLPASIGGVYFWSEYTEGAELVNADRAGYRGRAVRFRMTLVRDDYATPEQS
jgi:hypothetical protein